MSNTEFTKKVEEHAAKIDGDNFGNTIDHTDMIAVRDNLLDHMLAANEITEEEAEELATA